MGFLEALNSGFRRFLDFETRSSRSEFWWWWLFSSLLNFNITLGTVMTEIGLITFSINILTFIPSLAVAVRRLHDIDRSGWWLLLYLVPIVGWAVLLYWAVTPGRVGPNQYGADPLASITPAQRVAS
jgi:uncharacterized membrane protein YhaH (DUF805 family)